MSINTDTCSVALNIEKVKFLICFFYNHKTRADCIKRIQPAVLLFVCAIKNIISCGIE